MQLFEPAFFFFFLKLKGILSQSQDKALRRIGELREVSCSDNTLRIQFLIFITTLKLVGIVSYTLG